MLMYCLGKDKDLETLGTEFMKGDLKYGNVKWMELDFSKKNKLILKKNLF